MTNTFCTWAVAYKIDGKHYDDGKERISVTALFKYPFQAEEYIEKCVPEEDRERFFVIDADKLDK